MNMFNFQYSVLLQLFLSDNVVLASLKASETGNLFSCI